jgi:hypothetical protein
MTIKELLEKGSKPQTSNEADSAKLVENIMRGSSPKTDPAPKTPFVSGSQKATVTRTLRKVK